MLEESVNGVLVSWESDGVQSLGEVRESDFSVVVKIEIMEGGFEEDTPLEDERGILSENIF